MFLVPYKKDFLWIGSDFFYLPKKIWFSAHDSTENRQKNIWIWALKRINDQFLAEEPKNHW